MSDSRQSKPLRWRENFLSFGASFDWRERNGMLRSKTAHSIDFEWRMLGLLDNAGSSQAKKPDSFVPAIKPERRGYDRLWNWPLRPRCAVENS